MKDSLDVHAKYGVTYPSVRRVHYFNANERIIALTGQALYMQIAATGLDVSTLPNGLYLVRARAKSGRISLARFIKG